MPVYDTLNGDRVGNSDYINYQKNMKDFTKNNPWIKTGRVLSDIATLGLAEIGWNQYDKKVDQILRDGAIKDYNSGTITASDLRNTLSNSGVSISPEQEQWLQNEENAQATQEEREYNTEMRDTSTISQAEQLQNLGMNPGSVITMGGAGAPTSSAQDVSKNGAAQARFEQKAHQTRTLLGLFGALGSAGIYGTSRAIVGRAVSKSAIDTAKSMSHHKMSDLMYAHGRHYDRYGNYAD